MKHEIKWREALRRAAQKKYCILAFAALTAWAAMSAGLYTQESPGLTNADFIRLHVVANSDTYEDQALKLKVRDAVLRLLEDELQELALSSDFKTGDVPPETVRQAAQYVRDSFPQILKTAEEILQSNGYDYPVSISLSPRWIPEKAYGGAIFPAGEYQALHISIGEAQGSNWWCVLFPPLCLIDTSPQANTTSEQAVRLEIKFKTVELLEKVLE